NVECARDDEVGAGPVLPASSGATSPALLQVGTQQPGSGQDPGFGPGPIDQVGVGGGGAPHPFDTLEFRQALLKQGLHAIRHGQGELRNGLHGGETAWRKMADLVITHLETCSFVLKPLPFVARRASLNARLINPRARHAAGRWCCTRTRCTGARATTRWSPRSRAPVSNMAWRCCAPISGESAFPKANSTARAAKPATCSPWWSSSKLPIRSWPPAAGCLPDFRSAPRLPPSCTPSAPSRALAHPTCCCSP